MAVQDAASLIQSQQTRFQKKVLRWDYAQLRAHYKSDKRRSSASTLPDVAGTFSSVEDYLSVYEPLLLEECRAQITRGEEEKEGEDVLDFNMAALTECQKVNEFYQAKFAVPEDFVVQMKENDLVYLCKQKDLKTSALALVEGRQNQEVILRLYLDRVSSSESQLFLNRGLPAVRAALQSPKSAWSIAKVSSLSTITREYVALLSLDSFSLKDVILSATYNPSAASPKSVPPRLQEYLDDTLNNSQIGAIQAGLSGRPIVLIQGPPGTGKTQTILGLLSVLLHATTTNISKEGQLRLTESLEMPMDEKCSHWLKASPWLGSGVNLRDMIMPEDGDDGFFPEAPNQFRPEVVGSVARKHRAHVLVCAPSNSALDEIVLRIIRSGIHDENGESYAPSIVRMGLNAHHSVQSVTIQNLAEQRLKSIDRSMTTGPRGGAGGEERKRIELAIVEEAAIVCSTLSGSGSGVFSKMRRGFDVVVIDEAAQAVEPSTLVPMGHGCKQVFLVGDPKQLPATVLSEEAVQHGYGLSMFERFQKAGYPVQMLKTQYRMHPQIREFPSREFYDEGLEDGITVEQQTSRDWHEYYCFGPFAFFDVAGKEARPTGSYENIDEAEFVLVLYRHLIALYPQLKTGQKVAVISPYKQQVTTLRQRFQEVLGKEAARQVDINTVDGFQGREKDIAIFSCVRTNTEKGIGFVADCRRVNVGLTRAKASMLVVGCVPALEQDEIWSNLIEHARHQGRLIKVQKPFHSLFNETSLESMRADALREQQEQQQQQQLLLQQQILQAAAEAEPPQQEAFGVDQDQAVDDAAADGGDDYGDFEDGE